MLSKDVLAVVEVEVGPIGPVSKDSSPLKCLKREAGKGKHHIVKYKLYQEMVIIMTRGQLNSVTERK